jgi:hypothetical protein
MTMKDTQKHTELVEVQDSDDTPYCEVDPLNHDISLCGEHYLVGPEIPDEECTHICLECQRLIQQGVN